MNIIIKQFTSEYADAVVKLQKEWMYENITYGFTADTKKAILSLPRDYFYIAFADDTVVGYIIAEVIKDNEYNIFPAGADFLQINDLYVKADWRNHHIGLQLLKAVEKAAEKNGIHHFFISSATKDADAVRRFYTRNGYNIWTTCFFKNTQTEAENSLDKIQPVTDAVRDKVNDFISKEWYSTKMLIRGEVIDLSKVDGFVLFDETGTKIKGLITYFIRGEVCEITSLNSTSENHGIGSALIEKVKAVAKEKGCRRLQLLTTNDNIRAIRFYQKRGFEMVGINFGAIDKEREIKPQIPLIGMHGIPLHHEIDFAMKL